MDILEQLSKEPTDIVNLVDFFKVGFILLTSKKSISSDSVVKQDINQFEAEKYFSCPLRFEILNSRCKDGREKTCSEIKEKVANCQGVVRTIHLMCFIKKL